MPLAIFVGLAVFILALAGLIGWYRLRRVERRLAAHELALLLSDEDSPPDPPPDDGHRHLRLVALWIPLAAGLGWLARQLRRPSVGPAVALTAAAATITGLVLAVPGSTGDNLGSPPPPPPASRLRRPPQPPVQPPTRPPRATGSAATRPSSRPAVAKPGQARQPRQTRATPEPPTTVTTERPPVPSTTLPPTPTTTPPGSPTTMPTPTTADPPTTTRGHRRPRCVAVRLRPIVIHLNPPACLSPP